MQRLRKRQVCKAHERQKVDCTFIFFGRDGLLYEKSGEMPTVCLSIVCDPATWDLPHVYPKKRKKRKKGISRDVIICSITDSKD